MADAESVVALIAAYETAHGSGPDVDVDELHDEWSHVDLERDAWLLEEDGRVVAFACVYERGDHLNADGYVHPERRGRGLGSRLIELTEARARERGATALRNATLHTDEAGRALLEARGYRFVRAFLRMTVDLVGEPEVPSLPEGLVLDDFRRGDERAVHAAVEEAFAEHWGWSPEPFEEWRERRLEQGDPSLWRLVRDGDEIAAAAICDIRYGGGWVGALATRPAWRGRGLARVLLLASFRAFRERGQSTAALAVDSENPTGAVRLYESVGMRPSWRGDVHEKSLG
jgi:mycothiol synthase